MLAEVWGIKLDSGHLLPVYHIPYSQSELSSLISSSVNFPEFDDRQAIYNFRRGFPNDSVLYLGPLIPEPDLTFWRILINEFQTGLNMNTTLSQMEAGIHRPMIDEVNDLTFSIQVTPGLISTESDQFGNTSSRTSAVPNVNNDGTTTGRWFPQTSSSGLRITAYTPPMQSGMPITSVNSHQLNFVAVKTTDGVATIIWFDPQVLSGAAGRLKEKLILMPSDFNPFQPTFLPLTGYNPNWDMELIKIIGEEDDFVPRFDPTAIPNIGVYVVTKENLLTAFEDIWTRNFWEAFSQVFGGDPSSSLLSIRYYYGMQSEILPHIAPNAGPITMGNTVIDGQNDDLSVQHLDYNIIAFSCGVVSIPRKYGDHRDYTQCAYKIWIPFVGWVELNPDDVLITGQVCLTYHVNVATGEAIAYLSINDNLVQNGFIDAFWNQTCTMGVDIPYAITSSQSLGSVAVSLLSLGAVSGSTFTPNEGTYTNGNGMGHAIVTDFEPKIIVYQKDDLTGAENDEAVGLPSAQTGRLGDMEGYLQVEVAYNASFVLANRRMGEIVQLLQEGVYM